MNCIVKLNPNRHIVSQQWESYVKGSHPIAHKRGGELLVVSLDTRSGNPGSYIGGTCTFQLTPIRYDGRNLRFHISKSVVAALFKGFMPDVLRTTLPFPDCVQGLLHVDMGPSCSFPDGLFDGGAMLIPQLQAKFLWGNATNWPICYLSSCEQGIICLPYSGMYDFTK